ncbi:MAG: TolC family protein [Alphaproteobacteria bacterium]|uniref:TolC family protein n=1 Tax=Candidatus Nitrobium versatile TaxID=2884831 RepID=A0A953M2U9_9BACT|nr:TolC family protein [Candidatus Nitrobium versatile]
MSDAVKSLKGRGNKRTPQPHRGTGREKRQKSRGIAALTVFFLLMLLFPFVPSLYGKTEGVAGKSLTLEECVSIGLSANPAFEVSLQSLRAVQERVGEVKGGYYPSFKISSSYTYTTPQDLRMTFQEDVYDTRLFMRQTLFDAGATAQSVETVRHSIRAQEYEVRRTGLDIVQAVKTAFYDVLKKKELAEVAKTALQGAERHLEQAHSLYREGLAPRSDVIKAEVQVSNARLDVVKAESSRLSSQAVLASAMGVPAPVRFDITGREPDLPIVIPPLKVLMDSALALRPELKGSGARIESAGAVVRQVRSGFYPNVSLDASYGWQEGNFLPNDRKWSVGVTVGIPLFEQLTTRSKVNQAVANLNGLRAAEEQLARVVELEVEQAWLALKEAAERLAVTQKSLEQAQEDMRVSEGRYREGIGNILEVIDAQTALTQARTNRVAAAYDSAQAQARLDRAVGRGIEEETR